MLGANGLTGFFPLGTLENGITELETRLTLNGYLPPERPGCWSCQNHKNCMGGCYAVNYTTTGDPFRSGPECTQVTTQVAWEARVRELSRRDAVRVHVTLDEGFAN